MAKNKTRTLDEVGQESLTPQELEARVKRLTSIAANLFKRGSYEPAFESLMKAYLLDPLSPLVIDCEKDLLPTLELMRRRGSLRSSSNTGSAEHAQLATLLVQKMDGALRSGTDSTPLDAADQRPTAANPEKKLQLERIDAVKKKHEQQIKEREQQVWRNASSPPKVLKTGTIDAPARGPRENESQKNPELPPGSMRPGKLLT